MKGVIVTELGIKGRNVLVVGASKGIGRAIALGFAAEGARLVTVARSENLLKTLSEEAAAAGVQSFAYEVADVMSIDNRDFAETLLQKYGDFDIVVYNVGGSLISRDVLAGINEWEYALKFNALAAIDMSSVLIPRMKEKKWGRVIHISSISGVMLRGNPLYASAKAFLNAYVTTVGRALAKDGIVMSAVMPGAVAFEGSYWDKRSKDFEKPADGGKSGVEICADFLWHHQAVGRFGTPEEIANAVLFMASEQASFMPAALIPVDGANM